MNWITQSETKKWARSLEVSYYALTQITYYYLRVFYDILEGVYWEGEALF